MKIESSLGPKHNEYFSFLIWNISFGKILFDPTRAMVIFKTRFKPYYNCVFSVRKSYVSIALNVGCDG